MSKLDRFSIGLTISNKGDNKDDYYKKENYKNKYQNANSFINSEFVKYDYFIYR